MSGNIKQLPWPEWKIEDLLGRGAFGEVYRARKEEHGHTFRAAVKIIRIPTDEEEVREREADGISVRSYYQSLVSDLVNEIAMMEALKGASHIVAIDDYKIEEAREGIGWVLYIRMELLKNLNLYRREHPVTMEEICRLGCDICTALAACQKKQIVHRDIKPSNIFISEFDEFKLGDFGISRHMERTMSGLSRKGTVSYMAPEIYRGDAYNATVDIYALGLVLYQLANGGRLPFLPPAPADITPRDMESALARRIRGEEFPDPVRGGDTFGEMIRRACNRDPGKRYQTPEEFRDALTRWKSRIQDEDVMRIEEQGLPVLPEESDTSEIAPPRTERENLPEDEMTRKMFGGQEKKPDTEIQKREKEKTEKREQERGSDKKGAADTPREKRKREKKRKGQIGFLIGICLLVVVAVASAIADRKVIEKKETNIKEETDAEITSLDMYLLINIPLDNAEHALAWMEENEYDYEVYSEEVDIGITYYEVKDGTGQNYFFSINNGNCYCVAHIPGDHAPDMFKQTQTQLEAKSGDAGQLNKQYNGEVYEYGFEDRRILIQLEEELPEFILLVEAIE